MQAQLLEVLHTNPTDEGCWLALADALEECGKVDRAELSRLSTRLRFQRNSPECPTWEARQRELLAGGVLPCVPEVVNSVGMRLALIPSGTFQMGSPAEEEGRFDDEGPWHKVEITRAFYLGVFPVTQAEYQKVTGTNPSWFSATGGGKVEVRGLDTRPFPVEQVSWEEAADFCRRLTEQDKNRPSGHEYRLPREAEWEYGCRGGAVSSQPFHVGASLTSTQANFDGTDPYGGAEIGLYLKRTCPVGSFPPNAWGLYDLHGNVFEWCSDWYGEGYYGTSPRRDSPWPPEGRSRVIRGGGWDCSGRRCRSAYRSGYVPGVRYVNLGFRVALVPIVL